MPDIHDAKLEINVKPPHNFLRLDQALRRRINKAGLLSGKPRRSSVDIAEYFNGGLGK